MRGDLPACAVRLMAELPSRTHERQFGEHTRRASAHNREPRCVVIDGAHYRSLTDAARQLRKCRETIRKMIANGEASYA